MNTIEYLIEQMERIEKTSTDKISFKIGKYKGQYYDGDDTWITIAGDLFIRANYDTIFRVVDKNLGIIDDFDIIESEAIIEIDKKFPLHAPSLY